MIMREIQEKTRAKEIEMKEVPSNLVKVKKSLSFLIQFKNHFDQIKIRPK
jgi:hypothetical protein